MKLLSLLGAAAAMAAASALAACNSDCDCPSASSCPAGSAGAAAGGSSGSANGGSGQGGAGGGTAGASAGGSAGSAQGGAGGAALGGAAGAAGSDAGVPDNLQADLDQLTTQFAESRTAYINSLSGSLQVTGDATVGAMLTNMTVVIKGSALGAYDCSDSNFGAIVYTGPVKSNPSQIGTYNSYSSGAPCSIVVTSYGPIGSKVEGTFTGTVRHAQGDTLSVTNGQFSIVRAMDQ